MSHSNDLITSADALSYLFLNNGILNKFADEKLMGVQFLYRREIGWKRKVGRKKEF